MGRKTTLIPDASVSVEYLLQTRLGRAAAATLESDDLAAPALIDAEVLSVLRRWVLRRELDETRAKEALTDLESWRVTRLPHRGLLTAAFELRANYSAYDALYVALAQLLGARLITCDARLGRGPGIGGVEIEVVT